MLLAGSLGDDVVARARTLAARRAAGEPLQYVTGVAGFRRLDLAVGPGVLIPRPETESVAGRAMERLPPGGSAADVGTGSGAIALSIADERPDARVLATESSKAAFQWARRNADALGLSVELILCDLVDGLPPELQGALDVCVSNPPYVAFSERVVLSSDVLEHEPPEALFAGEHGLDVIDRVAGESLGWLRSGGWLVLEIGDRQGEAVRRLLEEKGYDEVSVLPDLAGRDRIAEGRRR